MNEEYISVSEMALFKGITSQHVYNLLHSGDIEGMEFRRGTMRGWLCKKPLGYDEWLQQNNGT